MDRYKMDTEDGKKVCLLPETWVPRKGDYHRIGGKDPWYRITRVSHKRKECRCVVSDKPI